MKVGLVQLCTPATHEEALRHMLPLVEEAARAGVQLIVTPEGSTILERDKRRLSEVLLPLGDDPVVARLRRLASSSGLWILVGSALVRRRDGRAANRQVLIDPAGRIDATYDKLHMFDVNLPGREAVRESEIYEPGERAVVSQAGEARLGHSICYDIRFPALYRALAEGGAEVMVIPAAFTRATGEAHWEVLVRARAIETGSFVLAPAQGGKHADGRHTWGRSLVVGPWGEVLAKLDHDETGVLIADLDLTAVGKARSAIPAVANGRTFQGP